MNTNEAMKILSLSVPFTARQAKRVYRNLARKAHPDKGGSHELMKTLNAAYELCSKGIEMPTGGKVSDWGVEFDFKWKPKKDYSLIIAVKRFQEDTLKKLIKNAHKGVSWRKESGEDLFKKLVKECGELWDEIEKRDKEAIISECADVANFAMMIADNARNKL